MQQAGRAGAADNSPDSEQTPGALCWFSNRYTHRDLAFLLQGVNRDDLRTKLIVLGPPLGPNADRRNEVQCSEFAACTGCMAEP